ncbi:MAG: cytidine deaminase [Peptococcaceae bacterium]|nr:cytidine deaminase [Peptococcaceae bacterium]
MTNNPHDWSQLIEAAWQAREYAHAPYSGFQVGAAVETADGRIYGGCNIENVSYGLTNCAERTAMFQAIANGEKELVRMAVCADTPEPVAPCGACRQVMVELGPQMELLLINKAGKQIYATVEELMPYCFDDFPQLRENDDEGEV